MTLDTVAVPTEVVLWRGTPTGTRTGCIDLNAGGDLAFFTVERVDGTAISNVEVLSCGNGQYGGLGNALFSNAQGVPARTKAVSGLLECMYALLMKLRPTVKLINVLALRQSQKRRTTCSPLRRMRCP